MHLYGSRLAQMCNMFVGYQHVQWTRTRVSSVEGCRIPNNHKLKTSSFSLSHFQESEDIGSMSLFFLFLCWPTLVVFVCAQPMMFQTSMSFRRTNSGAKELKIYVETLAFKPFSLKNSVWCNFRMHIEDIFCWLDSTKICGLCAVLSCFGMVWCSYSMHALMVLIWDTHTSRTSSPHWRSPHHPLKRLT